MAYLITYYWRWKGDDGYGMEIASDPIEWLADCQKTYPETYILINAQPMTEEQAEKYEGEFKGM
jgi:hypothetical protein